MTFRHLFVGLGVVAVIVFGTIGSGASETTETSYARATFAGFPPSDCHRGYAETLRELCLG